MQLNLLHLRPGCHYTLVGHHGMPIFLLLIKQRYFLGHSVVIEQNLTKVSYDPVPDVTPKWSLYEVISLYVSNYFGSNSDKVAISAQILEDHGASGIDNFVVPQINQTILMASKVHYQSAKNVLEGDKHVANIQQMLMSASPEALE